MTRHPLSSFFVLAFLISWAVGVPLALAAVASTLVMVWAVIVLIRWKSVRRPIGTAPGLGA